MLVSVGETALIMQTLAQYRQHVLSSVSVDVGSSGHSQLAVVRIHRPQHQCHQQTIKQWSLISSQVTENTEQGDDRVNVDQNQISTN